jgi:hypothetical protein
MALPNFFVLGAARCGTTSLHYWLDQHPDIAMSAIKEPNHFLFRPATGGPAACIGAEPALIAKSVPDRTAYERLFDPGATVRGDASPLYLYTRETPGLIRARVPGARLVAVLREPVERTWSHYRYVTAGADAAGFAAAVRRELGRGYEPYRTGTHYLRLSRYAEQVQRYREVFDPDQLLVLRYEDLVTDPGTALARICRHVGVDEGFAFDTAVRYNPSGDDRSLLARVDRAVRPALPYVKRALPAGASGRLARLRARRRAAHRDDSAATPPPADVAATLHEEFSGDREWLQRELGLGWPSG